MTPTVFLKPDFQLLPGVRYKADQRAQSRLLPVDQQLTHGKVLCPLSLALSTRLYVVDCTWLILTHAVDATTVDWWILTRMLGATTLYLPPH